jgi:hypothetical protein
MESQVDHKWESLFLDFEFLLMDLNSYLHTTSFLWHHCGFVVSFGLGNESPTTLFFFKIILAILGPLNFHMNFRTSFSILQKYGSWNLDKRLY